MKLKIIKNILALAFTFIPGIAMAASIDINTATLTQLDELAGIGPAYARAIIDVRPFSSVDDLLRVKGIGEKTLQKIKEQGLACVNCATTSTSAKGPAEDLALPSSPGLIINEIMPSPDGPDETNEWIELHNLSGQAINLAKWQMRDTAGTTKAYLFSEGALIAPDAYMVVARPETKIMLNDEQDGIELLMPDGNVADSVSYQKAPRAQSYSKSGNLWQWSTAPTPGTKNILPKPQKSATNAVSLQHNSGQVLGQKPQQPGQTAAIALSADESFKNNRPPAGAQILFAATGLALIVCGAIATGYYFFKKP